MKRTCLQKNTYTDEHPDAYRECEFHPAEISVEEQLLDPKEIQHVKSFVRMKRTYTLLLILALLSIVFNLSAKNPNHTLKAGDWFDCEIEFENGVPVFRNHFFGNENISGDNELVAIRFTNGTKNGWNYEVLRYRLISYGHYPPNYPKQLLSCFDTWYPDYSEMNMDSVRKSLKGTIEILDDGTAFHSYKYSTGNFSLTKPFSYAVDGIVKSYVSSFMQIQNDKVSNAVERVVEIVFQNYLLQTVDDSFSFKKWITKEGSIVRSIHYGVDPKYKHSLQSFILPNGLPYAFSDSNKQKVFAITNANFPLPNQAIVNIVDERTNDEKSSDRRFSDLISFDAQNPAHVISESGTPGFVRLTSKKASKTYQLKSGVEFACVSPEFGARIYLEPGDTLYLILTNELFQNFEIRNNKNTVWRNSKKGRLTPDEILTAPITAEYKSFLILNEELLKRLSSFERDEPIKNTILDFYPLKSYHYQIFDYFQMVYRMQKENQIRAQGVSFRTGFMENLISTNIFYTHFQRYFGQYSILTGQYSFYRMLKNEQVYSNFSNQCGDTLLLKDLTTKWNGRKSIEPGNVLPFDSLLDEEHRNIPILPSKGKYRLLLLYTVKKDHESFLTLQDSLRTDIEYSSFCLNKTSVKEWKARKEDVIYGHPEMNLVLDNLLVETLIPAIILYDHNGKILYTDFLRSADTNGAQSQNIAGIQAAINEDKTSSKGNAMRILWLAIVVICTSYVIIFVSYKLRLKRIQNRNYQQQMIQELKLKSVQSQLNPHFLFNALNSIQVLVNSGNTQKANNYLVGFSELLRGVLKNSDRRLVPLSDEMELIRRYCELEKLRSPFDCNIEINTQTPIELIEVPYMLLQPIVENAIKHGIAKLDEKGQLHLAIHEEGSSLQITISDTGPGFGKIPLAELIQKGKGLKLSMEKLDSLYGSDAKLFIVESENGKGGVVCIELKIG